MKLKNVLRIRIQLISMTKKYVEFNTQLRIEAEKNSHKDGRVLYKLMSNAVYGKTMEHVRNVTHVKLASNNNKQKNI